MTKKQLITKLTKRPGYQKWSPTRLAEKFNIDVNIATITLHEVKGTTPISLVGMRSLHEKPAIKTEALFEEFLAWRKNRSLPTVNTDEPLPKPFLTGDIDNVLVIGDLHEPFCLNEYLVFCREQQEKFNCGTVVFIGDIIDNHYTSYHEDETSTYGPNEELQRAKDRIQRWYKVFPVAHVTIGNHDRMAHRKAKSAGIADKWVRGYSETLATPGWKFVEEIIINGVCYNHGEGGTARTRMKNESMSQVQGHLHSQGYVEFSVGTRHIIFGMQVGCGIDRTQFAFAYGKSGKKPVISCGVVLNKGKLPILLPMTL